MLLSNRTSNFGIQLKYCHLDTLNLFMVKLIYLKIRNTIVKIMLIRIHNPNGK